MSRKLDRLLRGLKIAFVTLGALALALALVWLAAEWRWGRWRPFPDDQAFLHGTIGLELAPLKYVLVMEKVSKPMLVARPDDPRPWTQFYGFLARPEGAGKPACEANVPDVLPVGFAPSRRVPVSGTASPIRFVGLACTACHSVSLHTQDDDQAQPPRRRAIVYGAGNNAVDMIAFTDGLKNAVSDPSLSASKILAAYDEQCGEPKGLWARTGGRLLERTLIAIWLSQFRQLTATDATKYDLPFSAEQIKNAANIPAGPSRTRPFRSVIRVMLKFPGAGNLAFSKIPAVFEQGPELRPWSQYDGSIGDHVIRSLVAAHSSGASAEALSKDEIFHNVEAAADYTLRLGSATGVPRWAQMFPEEPYRIDPQRAERGFAVYRAYCNGCHGHRPIAGGPWSLEGAGAIHRISPLAEIGTDPFRIDFRYSEMIPLAVNVQFPGPPKAREGWSAPTRDEQAEWLDEKAKQAEADRRGSEAGFWKNRRALFLKTARLYPAGHPFAYPLGTLRKTPGFINNPIPFAYLRAPYLHNASVPTLAQLINLEPRPSVFCRGDNAYDPVGVGLIVTADLPCPPELPFRFDTAARGNSNAGHDFPWAWDDPARDPERLRDLLEYLKTL